MNQPTLDGFIIPAQARCYDRVQTQGQQAVKTGATAEATIFCILKERGFTVQRQIVIGTSIYDTELRADFYIAPCTNFPAGLIIESKWQESAGSVDEKFAYLVENIRTRYPAPCIIILDGGGYRPKAAEWARRQVDGVRLIGVYTFAEFLSWCNRNL